MISKMFSLAYMFINNITHGVNLCRLLNRVSHLTASKGIQRGVKRQWREKMIFLLSEIHCEC